MIGGLTKAQKVYDTAQTKSGVPVGLVAGQFVLLRGQGGSPLIPHDDNGVWAVGVGGWTRLQWDLSGSPHVQVSDPATGDGGDAGAGLGATWSSGTLTFGGGSTSQAIPSPPAAGGGIYFVRVITGVGGRRITLLDAGGGTVGQTEYQPGGGDGPDGSERVFRRGAASANVPTTVTLSDQGLGMQIEVFRP